MKMMIIALFGSDSYRRIAKVQELVTVYRAKYANADLLTVDLGDDPESWVKAADFLRQPSMFVDSKVLVVREPTFAEAPAGKPAREWHLALEEAVAAEGVVVVLSSEADPAETFPFLGGRDVKRQEFKELEGRMLEVFTLREQKARGLALDPAALRFLLAYASAYPVRSARIVSELDRLALAGLPSPISRADLERLIVWSGSEEVRFGARRVCEERTPFARLMALEALLLLHEAPAKLFNIIAYQASGAALAAFAEYDIALKSGRLEYEEALTDFSVSAFGESGITRAEAFSRDGI